MRKGQWENGAAVCHTLFAGEGSNTERKTQNAIPAAVTQKKMSQLDSMTELRKLQFLVRKIVKNQ
jgi:hypothetical protein